MSAQKFEVRPGRSMGSSNGTVVIYDTAPVPDDQINDGAIAVMMNRQGIARAYKNAKLFASAPLLAEQVKTLREALEELAREAFVYCDTDRMDLRAAHKKAVEIIKATKEAP